MSWLGDVAVQDDQVFTPVGSWPLAGTRWTITAHPPSCTNTPGWAVAMAVISCVLALLFLPFTCGLSLFALLGLFFLCCKETTTEGMAWFRVDAPPDGGHYVGSVYCANADALRSLVANVNHVQHLAMTQQHYPRTIPLMIEGDTRERSAER